MPLFRKQSAAKQPAAAVEVYIAGDVGRNNPVTKSSRIWLMWDRLMPARVDSQKVCETVHAQFAMGNVQSLSLELLIRHLFQRNHRPIPISSTQLTGSARLGIVL